MKTALLCLFALLPLVALAESGGPDPVGYSFARGNSAGFQTIASTSGAVAVLAPFGAGSDDLSFAAAIGFTFPFYGVGYTAVRINTNGIIGFGVSNTGTSVNADLTTATLSANVSAAAVFWDDLNFPAGQPGGLWVKTRTVGPLQEFVVEWDRVGFLGAPAAETVTFQAIFRSDGSFTFLYPDVTSTTGGRGASATFGIRDISGHTTGRRLQNSFNTAYLSNDDRIDYTRTPLPDLAAQALDFSGQPLSPKVNTVEATADGSDADVVPSVAEGKSVWFLWTAPSAGLVSFSTAASSFDTVLAVLIPGGAVQGTDDNAGGDGTSRVGPLVCTANSTFLIEVAGKDVGGTITSGLAQVTASFTPAERVSFRFETVQGWEGRPLEIALTRQLVNPATLDVAVEVRDDSGVVSTPTVRFEAGVSAAVITITPAADAVFTPGRRLSLSIVAQPGISISTQGNLTVEVLDDEPARVTAGKFFLLLTGGANPEDNAALSLSLASTGTFTGQLIQGATLLAFKGQMDAFGGATVLLPREELAPLALRLNFTQGGTVVGGGFTGPDGMGSNPGTSAFIFGPKNKVPTAIVGRYTLLTAGGTLAGSGYGTGTIAATGAVKFAGVLADGTPFSFGTTLGGTDASASRPIVASTRTHGGKGYFALQTSVENPGTGFVFRPAGVADKATSAFAAGYSDEPTVSLVKYTPPAARTQPSAGFIATAGQGTFGLGTAAALTDTVAFTLAATGKATSPTAGFTLKLDPKTGLYRGTRPNPVAGGKPIPFSGALDQTVDSGTGLGTGFGYSHEATTARGAFIVPRP